MDIGYLLSRTARWQPNALAAIDGNRRLTYRQLDARVTRLANALIGLGLRPGDRVLDLQNNGLEYVETDIGLARAGLVRVAPNTRLLMQDWLYIAQDCGARGLIYGRQFHEAAAALVDDVDSLEIVIGTGAGPGLAYEEVIDQGSAIHPGRVADLDDLASLNYSSGTTGRPKGCRRTNRNRLASCRDILISLTEGTLGPGDVWLHAGSMTHASGLFVLPSVAVGATQVIASRFDEDATLRLIEKQGVTGTFLVPTMIERVIGSSLIGRADISTLKSLLYAGAPMAPDRIRSANEVLGGRMIQFYGLVEAIPPLSVLTKHDHLASTSGDHPERIASIGREVFGCRLEILDDDGNQSAPGEIGELSVTGEHVMAGYWGRQEESNTVLAGDRLRTGDLGRYDEDGYIWLLDRKSDMIISGGYNVFPREVEDVVGELPGIAAVAVVGMPDREWGQVVAAFVVPLPGSRVTAEDIVQHCRSRLAGFKQPRRIEFRSELPKTSTEKVSRRLIREGFDHEN